ncbi:MAG: AMP-binding protein, partial [Ferruginibacter sp.]|nr:AMP-binding protein [Chitinophagaceae bacterium]
MKNKQINKTLIGKTGKDLLNLMGAKGNPSPKPGMSHPSSSTEITLYNFWKSLLGHDVFGINDDFFQVGGNSLKAIQLLSRISSHFLVQISLTDIFLQPSIAQIAELIDGKQKGKKSLPALIKVKEKQDHIPLSFNQERLWFVDHFEGSLQYHIPAVLRWKGKLNRAALNAAFVQIVSRHEILRTFIREEAGQGYQFIQDQQGWQLTFTSGVAFTKDPQDLQLYVKQLINKPFDLAKDYMLRAELISLAEQEHVLVITLHHIASDGWSTSIIVRELVQLYKAFEESVVADLEPLIIQYADFAIWQRQYLQGAILDEKLAYWKRKLEGVIPLQLPTDYSRPAVQSFNGSLEKFNIDKELTNQLRDLCRQQGVTLFMLLLAAFKVLLSRYSGQQDIAIGTAMAGRQQEELEGLIGFFVNTLVLRSQVDNNLSFTELLQQVKTTTLEAFENQDVPFEKVVEAVVIERDNSRSPLFQVMLVLQNTPDKEGIQLGQVTLSEESFENNKVKFELDFSLTETSEGLQGSVEYCTDLYQTPTIKRMLAHLIILLNSLVKAPGQKIGLLPILSTREKEELLESLHGREASYPLHKSLIDLFEEQVLKTPGSTALIFEDVQLSYHQLNERSNQLAHYLKSKEVTTGTLVPVCMERSIEMVIAILGILKAGGAYVPIDADYPFERIRYMLEDTGSKILLTNNEFAVSFAGGESLEMI